MLSNAAVYSLVHLNFKVKAAVYYKFIIIITIVITVRIFIGEASDNVRTVSRSEKRKCHSL